jgi:hypothetical protein
MQISNAFAWGQLQLRGGWKNVLSSTGAYFAILGALILGSLRLDPTAPGRILDGWAMGLLGLQLGVVLYGFWAISSAVRKDVASRLIESHRLMPLSGADAIAGYILGGGVQAMALFLVNVALGTLVAGGSTRVVPAEWFKANFLLGVFGASGAFVVAFVPLVFARGLVALFGLLWVGGLAHQIAPGLFPALTLLIGPLVGDSVFGVFWARRLDFAQELSMGCQVLVALLCYVGAVNKYRREDVLAFGPLLGLVVLAAYVAISAAAVIVWEEIRPRALDVEEIEVEAQLVIATLGGLLLAALPVSSAAWSYSLWRRREDLQDPTPHRRAIPVMLIVLGAALLAAALAPLTSWGRGVLIEQAVELGTPRSLERMLNRRPGAFDGETILRTAAVMFAWLASLSYLLRLCYQREIRTKWIVGLFVALTWLGPAFVDFIIYGAMQEFAGEQVFRQVSGASPLVAMIYLWGDIDPWRTRSAFFNTNLGIAVQLVIALALGVLYHSLFTRRNATATLEPTT